MVAYGSCNPLFDGIFGRFGLPGAPRASHRTIRLSWRAELLPALAFADVLDHGGRRHRRKRAISDVRADQCRSGAERSVNIGDDSLPGPWNLVSPSAPNHGNPRKPGGLTDSCSEPLLYDGHGPSARPGSSKCVIHQTLLKWRVKTASEIGRAPRLN